MPRMQTMWEYIMQLIYPPHCLFCDALLPPGEDCDDCQNIIDGLKLKGDKRAAHADKSLGNVDGVVSSFVYTGAVSAAIIDYKFHGKNDFFREMAAHMAVDIAEMMDVSKIEFVTCVPSCKTGNLHARLLASGVARCLGKPFDAKLIKKIRQTEKQHNLEFEKRAKNIKDAFAPNRPQKIKGQCILICDDVLTSGNTLNECAAALRKAGAKMIFGCTFAQAHRQSPD